MKFTTDRIDDGIAVFRLSGRKWSGRRFGALNLAIEKEKRLGASAVLLECSQLSEIGFSGTAGLAEMVARRPNTPVHLCGISQAALQKFQRSGIDRALHIHPNVSKALKDPILQRHRLTRTRAFIFGATRPNGIACLPGTAPEPLTDILGAPILERVLQQCAQFGLEDFVISPGDGGEEIVRYFHDHVSLSRSPFFVNVAQRDSARETPAILSDLQNHHRVFSEDIIIASASALTCADIADFMNFHRASKADLSCIDVIRGSDRGSPPALHSPSVPTAPVMALKAAILDDFHPGHDTSLEHALMSHVARNGGRVARFKTPAAHYGLWSPSAYFALLKAGLKNLIPAVIPVGQEIGPNIWRADKARLSRFIATGENAYFSDHCAVGNGTHFVGTNILGRHAEVSSSSRLENSIVWSGTRLTKGFWCDHQVSNQAWSTDLLNTDAWHAQTFAETAPKHPFGTRRSLRQPA